MIRVRVCRDDIIQMPDAPSPEKGTHYAFSDVEISYPLSSPVHEHGFSPRQFHENGVSVPYIKETDCKPAGPAVLWKECKEGQAGRNAEGQDNSLFLEPFSEKQAGTADPK